MRYLLDYTFGVGRLDLISNNIEKFKKLYLYFLLKKETISTWSQLCRRCASLNRERFNMTLLDSISIYKQLSILDLKQLQDTGQ